jgi:hypothetical protein
MSNKKGLSRWEAQAGQDTELMALADASGLPLAVCAANASSDEVTLVEAALAASFLRERPERLIADRHMTPTRSTPSSPRRAAR